MLWLVEIAPLSRFVMIVLGFSAVQYEHTRRSNKKWNTNRMLSLRGSDIGTSALFDELERAAVIVCSCTKSCLNGQLSLCHCCRMRSDVNQEFSFQLCGDHDLQTYLGLNQNTWRTAMLQIEKWHFFTILTHNILESHYCNVCLYSWLLQCFLTNLSHKS